MNETEMLATVRQLAQDLRELTPDAIAKSEALKLLRSERGGLGGPLVQWLNQETDSRRRLVLRSLIKHVVQAGYQQKPVAVSAAAKDMDALCNRLSPMVEPEQQQAVAGVAIAECPLTDNDAAILEKMLSMGATANSPVSSKTILSALSWTSEGKRAFARLKDYEYVLPMKGVGFYLTEAGIIRAKSLLN